ncbi:MAG TPA: zinc ABC transporter substrate-binding protein [Actinomycetota bacterium]|nr:zinc ABC transporter substrate-binding protein [Actinomycetota bacterium]
MILRLILIIAATLTGCSRPGPSDERLTVAAGLYPLAEAARAVAGGRAAVGEVVPPGAEPHDAEVSPDQVDLLLDADLVVTVEGLQPSVDDVVASRDRGSVVVPAGPDRHPWLDPIRMRGIAGRVSEALADADPAGAGEYRGNERSFARELERLDAEYSSALSGCEDETLVVTHAAFGALQRYGLRQEAIVGSSPEAEPDPARLAELSDLMRKEGIDTVFAEPYAPQDVAQTLARDAGARVLTLDPIERAPRGGGRYLDLMRQNLDALREGLGC